MSHQPPRNILLYQEDAHDGKLQDCGLPIAGYRVVGPFAAMDDMLEAAERHVFDVAVVSLGRVSQPALAVADALVDRDLPVVLVADYGAFGLPVHFGDCQVVTGNRPSLSEAIEAALVR